MIMLSIKAFSIAFYTMLSILIKLNKMKKEYPLLFKLFCTEIFNDISNIEDFGMPNMHNDDFVIYIKDEDPQYTPKDEVIGWIFENRVVLYESLYYTEQQLQKVVD